MTAPNGGLRRGLAIVVAALAVAGALGAVRMTAQRDPLRRIVSAAAAAGSYTLTGTTAGLSAGLRQDYAVSGSGDMRSGELLLTVGASAPLTYILTWPDVTAAGSPVERQRMALILPSGDPLALVASGHSPGAGPVERIGDRSCRRYSFLVWGRSYADWWLRHPHHTPVNADAGGLQTFSGQGQVWADAVTWLPCRVWAELALPRLAGEQPGTGWTDWTYSDWGSARSASP